MKDCKTTPRHGVSAGCSTCWSCTLEGLVNVKQCEMNPPSEGVVISRISVEDRCVNRKILVKVIIPSFFVVGPPGFYDSSLVIRNMYGVSSYSSTSLVGLLLHIDLGAYS